MLKGINISLSPGEVSPPLLGGERCGKSTLMKIIMGIYKSDQERLLLIEVSHKNLTPTVALSSGIWYRRTDAL